MRIPPLFTLSYIISPVLLRFPQRELGEFYLSIALRTFALGLIAIFEPIYIFLHVGRSIPLTLFYFGAVYVISGLFAPVGMKICSRLGVKRTMVASIPCALLYYGGLWLLPSLISP